MKVPGAYFFSPDRAIWSGRWTDLDLKDVVAANRDKSECPWCGRLRYSEKTRNCASCDTFPNY